MTRSTIIIAKVLADTKDQDLMDALFKLVDLAKSLEGCVEFNLYQDNDNLELFWFFQTWETRLLWIKYLENKKVLLLKRSLYDKFSGFSLNELTEVK